MQKTFLLLLALSALIACNNKTDKQTETITVTDTVPPPPPPGPPPGVEVRAMEYKSYCNARYNYCIDYPEILNPQPESGNGDGRVFTNKAGEEVLIVYGTMGYDVNGDPYTLAQQYNSDRKNGKIVYQKLDKNFFVISGTKDGKLFYQKTIEKDGTLLNALLQYSESEKDIYDAVAERIASSFN